MDRLCQLHLARRSYRHKPPFSCSVYPHTTLPEVFDETARRLPNKAVSVVYQSRIQRDCWTFSELQKQSVSLSLALYRRGYRRGDRVALFAPNCSEYVLVVLALSRVGCNAFLLSNLTTLADDVLHYSCRALVMYIKDAKEKEVCKEIANRKGDVFMFGPNTDGLPGSAILLHDLIDEGRSLDRQQLPTAETLTPDDPLFVFFTSGSSGKPKGAQYTHTTFLRFFTLNKVLEVTEDSCFFNDRPMTWTGGMNTLLTIAVIGARSVTMNTSLLVAEGEVDLVMEILKREKCTHTVMMQYFMVDLLSRSDPSLFNVPHLQCIVTSGQMLDLNVLKHILHRFPGVKHVVNTYGLTETGEVSQMLNTTVSHSEYMEVGEDVEMKLIDENGLDVPPGTEGEICVRSPWILLQCYVDNEEASKKATDGTGWFHTADIGVMNTEGQFKICGRKDDMIKRATIKVFPAEVENILSQNPAVQQVIVVGVPDDRLGEELCACVILNNGFTTDGLQEWCQEQFSVGPDGLSLAPKFFLVFSEFVATASGKTQRKSVKQMALKMLDILD